MTTTKLVNLQEFRPTTRDAFKTFSIEIEDGRECTTSRIRVWRLNDALCPDARPEARWLVEALRYGGHLPNTLHDSLTDAMQTAMRLVQIYTEAR